MDSSNNNNGQVQGLEKSSVDRGTDTRKRLLDATYSIIKKEGCAGLRSAKVSDVSGVSTGGLLHHYPTKELLVAAVFERLSIDMEERTRQAILLASDEAVIEAIVLDAKSRFFENHYKVLLDISLACAREKPFRAVRRKLAEKYTQSAIECWSQRLSYGKVDTELSIRVSVFLWNMVEGLAVRNLVQSDLPYCDRVIEYGLKMAHSLVSATDS